MMYGAPTRICAAGASSSPKSPRSGPMGSTQVSATRRATASGSRRCVLTSPDDLLDGPAVAVGILEVDEAAPGEVLDLADCDAVFLEIGVGGDDVRDHNL